MIGADGSTYTPTGEWNFNVAVRTLHSTDHYNGTIEQVQRQTLGTYVVNNQHSLDFTLGRQFTPRISLSASIPYFNGSWSIPSPTAPTPGPRAAEPASGLGDIVVAARSWVLNPATHRNSNFSVGLGLKMPTGNDNAQATFVDITGRNSQARAVDQSVQPGDGGWGMATELAAFHRMKRVMVFGSLNYLINPRDTNNTPSILVNLGIPGLNLTAPANVNRLVNSVPDQYVARIGASAAIGKGFAASLSWHIEGMPRYDLIGRSDGFRRPGKEMFIEPGISYSRGSSSFAVNVPLAYYRNREPDAYTGALGDATFPNAIVMGTYSLRFGGLKSARKPVSTPGTVGSAENGAQPDASADGAVVPLPTPSVQAGQEVVRMRISGMTCDQCVETVRTALVAVKGVVSANVSLAGHEAVVVYDPARVKVNDIVNAVNKAKGMNPYTAQVQQD